MSRSTLARRAALLAASLGATAAIGVTPALASCSTTYPCAGEDIYGNGSSLQLDAQTTVWMPKWNGNANEQPTLTSPVKVANYNPTGSGAGLDEFGNNTGVFNLSKDPVAGSSTNEFGTPVLDAYVGTDDPPTSAQITSANTAAGASPTVAIHEVTIPVAEAPVAVIFSLPTGITAGTGSQLNLKNTLLQQIWTDAVPASTDYAGNTWGAILENAGWHKVASAPAAGQFTDDGSATGGAQGITLQVRAKGSGTSYAFKGFLYESGAPGYTQTFVVDDPTWPSGVAVTSTGNSNGPALVTDTTNTPGSVGYANLADTNRTGSPANYTNVATVTPDGTHQILFANVQDNYGSSAAPIYTSPLKTAGVPNLYTGGNINNDGGFTAADAQAPHAGVGSWDIPGSTSSTGAFVFNSLGSWGGTLSGDPDTYDDSGNLVGGGTTTPSKAYPIAAATYDLAFTSYSRGNMVGQFGGTLAQAKAAGAAVQSYVKYVTSTKVVSPPTCTSSCNTYEGGQTTLKNAKDDYAALPSKIASYAGTAASKIAP